MLVGTRAEAVSCVGLRKGYSTKLPLIRRWRCGARVVEEPGLKRPDSQATILHAAAGACMTGQISHSDLISIILARSKI